MDKTTLKKIILLNKATLNSAAEVDSVKIIKNFTDVSVKVLHADFGFAWWKFYDDEDYKLVYKTRTTPYEPTIPRKNAGNDIARITRKPFCDSNVNSKNYSSEIIKYVKSYMIIPIYYKELNYGSLVVCYKKEHSFSKDENELAVILGTSTAQAITNNNLTKSDNEARRVALLLSEERMKTEFMANANHELRTPIAIIKGHVDLILRERGKENRRYADDAINSIDEEVRHLTKILSDLALLTSGDVEEGSKLIHKKVSLDRIIKKVVKRVRIIANEKNIKIKANLKKISIQGDEKYLVSLFQNLIKNAVTYGRQNGWIKIEFFNKGKDIEIEISDNGIGISKKDIDKVFNRFYRADKSRNSQGKRTGLGLSIAKWIAESHGGSINVESVLGIGTIFRVILPFK